MAEMSSTESEWLSQLTAMRQAIMKLNLPKNDINNGTCYGSNLELDFDDDDFFSTAMTDNIWDVISSDDDETGDDLDDIHGVPLFPPAVTYDYHWLESRCNALADRRPGLPADELSHQIAALLATDSGDDELQMSLVEVVGFDDLDFVIELITRRKELICSSSNSGHAPANGAVDGELQTRAERERTLRQQDYNHKHAPLPAAQNREDPKYPHVYNAYDSRNTLALGERSTGYLWAQRRLKSSYTPNMLSQLQNLTLWGRTRNWYRYPRWTGFAGALSRDIKHLTGCRVYCMMWLIKRTKTCLSAPLQALVKPTQQC